MHGFHALIVIMPLEHAMCDCCGGQGCCAALRSGMLGCWCLLKLLIPFHRSLKELLLLSRLFLKHASIKTRHPALSHPSNILQAAPSSEPAYEDRLMPPWPLIQACSEEGIPVTTLFTFCSEGNNVPHGMLLANAVHSLLACNDQPAERLSTEPSEPVWQPPRAWQHLYGPLQPAY